MHSGFPNEAALKKNVKINQYFIGHRQEKIRVNTSKRAYFQSKLPLPWTKFNDKKLLKRYLGAVFSWWLLFSH